MTHDARNTDPQTSHEAAQATPDSIKGEVRRTLYRLLEVLITATDEELADRYEIQAMIGRAPVVTAARLRHCRRDLVLDGLVVDTGERREQSSGSKARVWAVA